jgi:hypothetical protein
MMRRPLAAALASAVLVTILWGCGAAATPIPSTSGASAAASEAPASIAASAAEPSTAASEAAASAGGASFALPSLPSEAKDLEALLPDTICGDKATKVSMAGGSFLANAGAEFTAALSALGKTPADVSVAVAGGASGCSAVAMRIAGADQNALQSAVLASVQQGGGSAPTQSSLGGKTVYVITDSSGKKSYVYFKNDTIFIADTTSEADAGTIIQALP